MNLSGIGYIFIFCLVLLIVEILFNRKSNKEKEHLNRYEKIKEYEGKREFNNIEEYKKIKNDENTDEYKKIKEYISSEEYKRMCKIEDKKNRKKDARKKLFSSIITLILVLIAIYFIDINAIIMTNTPYIN